MKEYYIKVRFSSYPVGLSSLQGSSLHTYWVILLFLYLCNFSKCPNKLFFTIVSMLGNFSFCFIIFWLTCFSNFPE